MRDKYIKWLNKLEIEKKPNEWEVKKLFKEVGLKTPNGFLLKSGESFDDTYLKYPLAVKVCDSKVHHKTELGGLHLNVSSLSISNAIKDIRHKFPGSNILIEEMANYSDSEFIIGGLIDPIFGPAIMFGAGGILTELFNDVTFRLAPISINQGIQMLKELKISELFNGYRGSNLNLESLAHLLRKVSELIVAIGDDFDQLDINPIVYTKNGWIPLDGVILLKEKELI